MSELASESAAEPTRSAGRAQRGRALSAPEPFVHTPNAERYLLEADNLRRRQLRSALLHGSTRTWRDRRRLWPALVAGLILVAVIAAAIGIYGTFRLQQREQERDNASAISMSIGNTLAKVDHTPDPSE